MKHHPSYLSPKLQMRSSPEKGGAGVFALEPLPAGDVLAVWGGVIVAGARLEEYSHYAQTHGLQVDDDLYLLPLTEDDPSDYFNHCCNPNAGLRGEITLVAMRDIEAGEELTMDYRLMDEHHDNLDRDEVVPASSQPKPRRRR